MITLCKDCTDEKWCPTTISKLKEGLSEILNYNGNEKIIALGKNICYNLQYIQYLEKTLRELHLTEVIIKQSCKTYIITAVGIIEAIFYYLIVKNNLIKKSEYGEEKKITSSKFKLGNIEYYTETKYFKKTDKQYEITPDLDSMIKRIEKKKLTSLNHKVFPHLKKLRQLRNKVHLQCAEDSSDTDYLNFSKDDCYLVREILYELLTSDVICPEKNQKATFYFLKC